MTEAHGRLLIRRNSAGHYLITELQVGGAYLFLKW